MKRRTQRKLKFYLEKIKLGFTKIDKKTKIIVLAVFLVPVLLIIKNRLFPEKNIYARVIDYLPSQNILVVEDKKNREIRVALTPSTAAFDEKNNSIQITALEPGFWVNIEGAFRENKKYYLADKLQIKTAPSIVLTSVSSNELISLGKIIYGSTNIKDSKVYLNLKNRRTGDYLIKDASCDINSDGGKEYAEFFFPINFDLLTVNIKSEDPLQLEVFHKNEKGKITQSVKLSLKLDVKYDRNFNLYFPSSNNSEKDCSRVSPVKQDVEIKGKVINSIVDALIKGPRQDDDKKKHFTNFNKNIKLEKVDNSDGIITLDFNKKLAELDDCQAKGASFQLNKTLLQVPGVKAVKITIHGQEDQRFNSQRQFLPKELMIRNGSQEYQEQ
ncbi:MAG: GerMN domain-containing protein [Patescibacteria group bacterium]|jgi:hypothetical protein